MTHPKRKFEPKPQKPYTELIHIDPEKAAEFLQKNQNNRPMRNHTVKEMADKMKSGDWIFTHQGIAFNTEGILVDGQHRLAAIIHAGISVDMNVTYNLEQAAFDHVDTGGTRTASDLLSRRLPSVKNIRQVCSTAALMLRGIANAGQYPDKIIVVDFAEQYAKLINEVSDALVSGESRRILRKQGVLAAFCNAIRMPDGKPGGWGSRDPDQVLLIAMRLASQQWEKDDPMKTLFNRLLRDELDASKNGKITDSSTQYAVCVGGIRAALNGKSWVTAQPTSIEWGYKGDLVKQGTGMNVRGRAERNY